MSLLPYLAALGLPLALAVLLTWAQMRHLVWRIMPFAPLPALALALLGDPPMSAQAEWLILACIWGLMIPRACSSSSRACCGARQGPARATGCAMTRAPQVSG